MKMKLGRHYIRRKASLERQQQVEALPTCMRTIMVQGKRVRVPLMILPDPMDCTSIGATPHRLLQRNALLPHLCRKSRNKDQSHRMNRLMDVPQCRWCGYRRLG